MCKIAGLLRSLCVVGVDRMEKLLQFAGSQDPVGEVGFELVKGQLAIVWMEKKGELEKATTNICLKSSSQVKKKKQPVIK